MTGGGWFMILFSWTLIIGLSGFCMKRVILLRNSQAKHIKPLLDIDTQDLDVPEPNGKKKE